MLATTASGAVKSIAASAVSELDELVPGRLERRSEHAPDLAAAAVQADLHAAAAADERGIDPFDRGREAVLVGADAGGREPLGLEQHRGELRELVLLDGVDLGDQAVEREQLRVRDQRLAEPAHPVRRRLHREHDPPLQVLLRARELVRPQDARSDVRELARRDLEALGEVLLARADVEADQAGVRVLRREAVDGVGHPALLADLLEQARGSGAAEDRVEQRRGEAPPVGARDARRADADVVLLRVLLLEAKARRRRRDERPAQAHSLRRRVRRPPLRALDEPDDLVVLEVAGRRDDDVAADVHRAVVRGERATADARDHVARADHRPPERRVAEDGLREEVVHELLRRVLVHRDLLEDDLALGVELRERRREHHVRHHVDRRLEVRIRARARTASCARATSRR